MQRSSPREVQRKRTGSRMLVACINCKDRKLRCDDQVPACANCQRFNLVCLVEDPATKRRQPRNYLETLEGRVAQLEATLRQNALASPPKPLHETGRGVDDPTGSRLFSRPQSSPSITPQVADDATEVSDLATELGMLSVAAGAEPHYLGHSSVVGFSRVIHSALLQSIPRVNKHPLRPESGDKSMPDLYLLPDSESCIKLSDAYFQHIHTQYPFLHEPTFRMWEMKLLPSEVTDVWELNPVSLFFLYMVYAIGALLLPNLGYSPEQLCSTAQLYVDSVLQLENLETIQAYLCFALYSIRSPAGTSVWRFSGLAVRQCIELGYHRHEKVSGSSTDPLRLELRKRAFWCAWTIDCMAACILGRPLALQNQEFDCEYPLDVDDMYISSHGILGTPRTPQDPPTSLTKGIVSFRIRSLWGRIQVSLYSSIANSSPSHPTYQSRVDELRDELNTWRSCLPPVTPPRGDTLSMFSSEWWYEFCYNYTILYLYRGQLTDPNKGTSDTAFMESVKAAEELCHGMRNIVISRQTTYTWGALHTVFIAGLTYLHCLWASAAVRAGSRQDAVSATCTDCTIVLVLMEQWHEAVEPYRDIFEALAARTMAMLLEAGSDKETAWNPPAQTNSLDSANLTQWIADISDNGMPASFGNFLTGFMNEMQPREQGGV